VKLNLITGNPDVAKSLISIYIVSCITTGKDWFDSPNTNGVGEALMLCGGDDWADTIVPRLMASGADLSKVHMVKMEVSYNTTKTQREVQLDSDMRCADCPDTATRVLHVSQAEITGRKRR
jgi:putative DNA primase/helicase